MKGRENSRIGQLAGAGRQGGRGTGRGMGGLGEDAEGPAQQFRVRRELPGHPGGGELVAFDRLTHRHQRRSPGRSPFQSLAERRNPVHQCLRFSHLTTPKSAAGDGRAERDGRTPVSIGSLDAVT